jgi:hypothetical protein
MSSWLSLFSFVLQRSVYQAGCLIIVAATVLFYSTTIRLSSWVSHYRGCHRSLQFYNDPFIKLDVSSWLPLLSSILQQSVYEAGCVIMVGNVLFNSITIRLYLDVSSSWLPPFSSVLQRSVYQAGCVIIMVGTVLFDSTKIRSYLFWLLDCCIIFDDY